MQQQLMYGMAKSSSGSQIRKPYKQTTRVKESKQGLDAKELEDRPFFNCKPMPKTSNKPLKAEPEGLGALVENDETLAAFMKSGKTYHLRDVDFDDKFLNEAILPPERTQNLLNKINQDYRPANLQMHRAEIFLVLSQQFDDIAAGFGADFSELIQLCCKMLMNELVEEENVFFNTISIMLQSLEMVLTRSLDDDNFKLTAQVFTIIKKLLSKDTPSKGVVSQMFFNSFNHMGGQFNTIHPEELRDYLHHSLDLIKHLVESEYNHFMSLSSRSHSVESNNTAFFTPLEGLEQLLRHSQYRRLMISDEYLWTPFSKLMSFMHDFLLQTSFNRIAGTKKQLFTVTYFAIFLSAVKYKSIQTALKESIPRV